MFPSPSDLSPLFHCPLCPSPSFPLAPTTLRCGHTLCASHLLSSNCPIPGCSAQQQSYTPNIPPSSPVAFFPAPLAATSLSSDLAPRRVDVRVNNIIQLLQASSGLQGDSVPTYGHSDDDSDPEDHSRSSSSSSSTLPRDAHSPPASRPSSPCHAEIDNSSTHFPSASVSHSPPRIASLQDFEKALSTELICEICFMMLYQPVTTPCQHTFCSKCLQRLLDHSLLCPLCREGFPGFAYFQEHPHNKIILSLLLRAFPEAYSSRGEVIEHEERDARLDTPIFVCQLSFPGMPTLLHFFEPQYRLMLRRCLENTSPTFGMIMPPRAAPIPGHGTNAGSEFGTMLEIRSVQMLADGRSMVETWGTHRFRILERGSLDGYMIGRIERIDDYNDDLAEWATEDEDGASSSSHTAQPEIPPSVSSPAPPVSVASSHGSSSSRVSHRFLSTPALLATCHAFLDQLRAGTAPWVVQRLNYTYGPQPPDTDPGAFSFWMGMVLPIDEHEKAKLLPVKSARLRLRMVVGWIEQLNSNWWFSSGCVVL